MSQSAAEQYRLANSVGDIVKKLAVKNGFVSPNATPDEAGLCIQKVMEAEAGMPRITTRRILRGYNRNPTDSCRPDIRSLIQFCVVLHGSKDDFIHLLCAANPELPIAVDALSNGWSLGDLDEALFNVGLDPVSSLA